MKSPDLSSLAHLAVARALDRLDGLARFGTRLGLEPTQALLAALGSPQEKLPTVLVAGTNGKGTVAALVDSMARAARLGKVGLYTSPHLEHLEERIRLGGAPIPRERLALLVDEILDLAAETLEPTEDGGTLTYFETLTLAAIVYFAREKTRLAILEVGLGGRLDATNATSPILSVVTGIGLDHTEHLGETLAEVAREKAGIFRSDVPAVSGLPTSSEAGRELFQIAFEQGTPFTSAPEVLAIEALQRFRPFGRDDRRLRVWLAPIGEGGEETDAGPSRERLGVEVFETALAGRHQAENLRTAVVAARILADEMGFERLKPHALRKGAMSCRWPGRLEEVTIPPQAGVKGLADGARLLLDVAHNPDGAAALAEYLATALGLGDSSTTADGDAGIDLLFGVLADKAAGTMLEILLAVPGIRRVTVTTPPGDRGRPAEEVAELAGATGFEGEVAVVPRIDRALDQALAALGARVLVVCGSLVTVGAVRERLGKRFGVPEPI